MMDAVINDIEKRNMKKILRALDRNCRIDIKGLAEKTGLSRQTASRLLEKMEDLKIIWGYNVIGDLGFLGLKHFTLIVKLKADINKEKILATYWPKSQNVLKTMEDVYLLNSSVMHGKYDFIAQFVAKDLFVAREVCYHIFGPFIKFVDEYEIEESIVIARKHGIVNPNMQELLDKYSK